MGTSRDEALDIGRALGNFNYEADKAATGSSTDPNTDPIPVGRDIDMQGNRILNAEGLVSGEQGPQGIQGIQGEVGPQGATGPTGPTGATGAKGNTGDTGATGAQGIQGIQGIAGDDGADGSDGATGPQGIQGVKGDTGDTGAQGIQGDPGDDGADGSDGSTGATGATGPQGDPGIAGGTVGWQGDWTTSTAYSENDAVSHNGSSYGCTSDQTSGSTTEPGVGGSWATVWQLLAQKGDTGSTGATGATGSNGTNGTDGEDGATGATGPQGDPGVDGDDGATGSTGATGAKGDKGDTGDTGPTGATGATGAAGADGSDGADADLSNVYPVGSIYISTVSTNPNTLFGFGTWVAYGEGRVLVGKEASGTFGTAGAEVGSETVDSSHTHSLSTGHARINNAGGVGGMLQRVSVPSWTPNARVSAGEGGYSTATTGGTALGGDTDSAGDETLDIVQPSIVVYMWNRTA